MHGEIKTKLIPKNKGVVKTFEKIARKANLKEKDFVYGNELRGLWK